jgi:hypothetical protein
VNSKIGIRITTFNVKCRYNCLMDKVSSSSNKNNNKCALCSKIIIPLNKLKFDTSKKGEEIIIDGIPYRFDAKDCATMFKRFKGVYGNKFAELLGQEQYYISDPFWNKVIPSKTKEIREIEKRSTKKKSISC